MVKNYYLLYGAQNVSVDDFGQDVGRALGMEVELRDSSYLGAYVKCIGPQADYLTIQPNEVDGELIEEDFKEYSVLVYVSNVNGKNIDKEARTGMVKEVFSSIPKLVLLKEEIKIN
jgi:hypothetical protein